MVTIKDIAEKADVSAATVSLALNDSDKIRPETIRKIKRIARELNYTPNMRGRALVKGINNTIGLVVPEIENPFYAEVVKAVKNVMYEQDFHVLLASTDYNSEEEKRYINLFKNGMIDGAIFVGVADLKATNDQIILELARDYIPVVNIFRENVQINELPQINARIKEALYSSTEYLIELGHTKIAYVGESEERLAGYKKALREHDLPIRSEYIFKNYHIIEQGAEVGHKLIKLADFPTGLVCYNDEIAMGVIQVLANQGIKIPENLSVVGCDNIKLASFTNPPLTTVDIPKREIAEQAAHILLEMIDRGAESFRGQNIKYDTELIERNSAIPYRECSVL